MFCPRAASPQETLVVVDSTAQPSNPFDSLPIEVHLSVASILRYRIPIGLYDTNAYHLVDSPADRRIPRNRLFPLRLSGLMPQCPRCHRRGQLLSLAEALHRLFRADGLESG